VSLEWLRAVAGEILVAAMVVVLGASGGCTRGSEGQSLRIDSLATDAEKLMLMEQLPPGTEEQEVLERLPLLAPVDPRSGTASQPIVVLGLPAVLEVTFREGMLQVCGYRLGVPDSVAAAILYRQLQSFYTAKLGNYHEEFANAGRPASSFWSSPAYGLRLTLTRERAGFLLAWQFTGLAPPPVDTSPAI